MPKAKAPNDADSSSSALPADWALSRVTESATRSVNLLTPQQPQLQQPQEQPELRTPEPPPSTPVQIVKETPLKTEINPDIFGAIGRWQERLAHSEPRVREVEPQQLDPRITYAQPQPQYQDQYYPPYQPAHEPDFQLEPEYEPGYAPDGVPLAGLPLEAEPEAAPELAPAPELAAPVAPPAKPKMVVPPRKVRIGLFQRLNFWRATTLLLAVAVLALGGVTLFRPAGFDIALAPLGVVNAPAPIFLAELGESKLRMTPLADIEVPAGNDLQLWMFMPNSDRAIALGVLPPAGGVFTPPQMPPEGAKLVISLEPHGGSTGGKITGKVLYGGLLANR